MAFSCEKCVDRAEGPGHYELHIFKSKGKCEDCRKHSITVDCKCYKRAGWIPFSRRNKV